MDYFSKSYENYIKSYYKHWEEVRLDDDQLWSLLTMIGHVISHML